MKTKTPKLAYEAPEASVDLIVMEQCILSTQTGPLSNFDKNSLYEEDFDE